MMEFLMQALQEENRSAEMPGKDFGPVHLRRYIAALLLLWTTSIAALFLWIVWQQTQQVRSVALAEARAYINRDEAFRRWAASHGGVYVPIDERTPPNPLLAHVPERDLVTPAGKHLTLMNSAYVLRQMSQDYAEFQIAAGHLTSLNPLRPENAPDAWEKAALIAFEQGEAEVFEFTEIDGEASLRLMHPILTRKSCLKCHAQQGYQVGDIRGGVAVVLPTEGLWAATRRYITGLGVGFGVLWLIGLLGILWGARRFFKDAKERKQAEETESRLSQERDRTLAELQMILDRMPIGCVRHDLQFNVTYWNPAAEKLFNFSVEEVIGKSPYETYIPPEAKPYVETIQQRLVSGDMTAQGVNENITKDGRRITGEWINTPLMDESGRFIGYLSMVQDVTERKRAEDEIRRLNNVLEERVRERTAQLEAANHELEAFSYSVSHDLRAPLRGIEGFSQALLMDCLGQLDDTGRHYLQLILTASQRMAQLIEDLLRLSRVTRADLAHQPVNLSAMAQEVAAEIRQAVPERSVELNITPDLVDRGDGRLLRIILENLLGNAFKFTAKQPQTRIEFGSLANPEKPPVYYVRDNGVGFHMDYAGKLFNPFQRLHSEKEFPGTGIGLAIVQRIIHRHAGRVWAESAPGQGATFFFTLGSSA